MTINEQQDDIIEEFEIYSDWMDKYEYIIQLGKELPLIATQFKIDQNLIKGCQSRVWLHAENKDSIIYFTADSDAIITKGIVALMVRVLSGHSPKEIIEAKLEFINKIGLKEHLSPTRANGLVSMIQQMKLDAIALERT